MPATKIEVRVIGEDTPRDQIVEALVSARRTAGRLMVTDDRYPGLHAFINRLLDLLERRP